jgi:hypothetical protein
MEKKLNKKKDLNSFVKSIYDKVNQRIQKNIPKVNKDKSFPFVTSNMLQYLINFLNPDEIIRIIFINKNFYKFLKKKAVSEFLNALYALFDAYKYLEKAFPCPTFYNKICLLLNHYLQMNYEYNDLVFTLAIFFQSHLEDFKILSTFHLSHSFSMDSDRAIFWILDVCKFLSIKTKKKLKISLRYSDFIKKFYYEQRVRDNLKYIKLIYIINGSENDTINVEEEIPSTLPPLFNLKIIGKDLSASSNLSFVKIYF